MSGTRRDDLLTRIMRHLPGFRGYLQREDREQSEQQMRQFVNQQLQQVKASLDRFSRGLADAGRIEQLAPVDELRAVVDSVCGQVDRPVPGAASLLGSVDEDALEDLYDLEATLMDCAVSVTEASQDLGASPADASQEALQRIQGKVRELAELVNRRRLSLDELAG